MGWSDFFILVSRLKIQPTTKTSGIVKLRHSGQAEGRAERHSFQATT
jgi:hypothetical protein